MIILSNVCKIYCQNAVESIGVENISLRIYPADYIAITGRSGCGKTTLLNLLGCMDTLTKGTYYFENQNISALKGKEAALFRNQKIGYIFQAFNLVNEISALENVCMPLGYAGVKSKKRKERGIELLKQVGLESKASIRPPFLSGGEQQRVAIARAMANSPQILLADEPTGNLDEVNSQIIMDLFADLNKGGMTIVMVTHSNEIALYAKSQIRMKDGRIVAATMDT